MYDSPDLRTTMLIYKGDLIEVVFDCTGDIREAFRFPDCAPVCGEPVVLSEDLQLLERIEERVSEVLYE